MTCCLMVPSAKPSPEPVFCGIQLREISHWVHVNLNRHIYKVLKNRLDELLVRVFGRYLKQFLL